MTERIDHATRALQLSQSEYSDPRKGTAVAIQTEALVHATLALVEQQRLANLVALGVVGGGPINNHYPSHVIEYLRGEFPEVAAALGITEETDDE